MWSITQPCSCLPVLLRVLHPLLVPSDPALLFPGSALPQCAPAPHTQCQQLSPQLRHTQQSLSSPRTKDSAAASAPRVPRAGDAGEQPGRVGLHPCSWDWTLNPAWKWSRTDQSVRLGWSHSQVLTLPKVCPVSLGINPCFTLEPCPALPRGALSITAPAVSWEASEQIY